MSVIERAYYAEYLAAVAGAALTLVLTVGSADAIAWFPQSAFDLPLSLTFIAVTYAISIAIAPWVAKRPRDK